jgi:hypothetical protein
MMAMTTSISTSVKARVRIALPMARLMAGPAV